MTTSIHIYYQILMSDLSNIFSKKPTLNYPVKRLFIHSPQHQKRTNEARGRVPQKSLRKQQSLKQHGLPLKDFGKRYIQQQQIKKEIWHYNQQILLVFIRKVFFVMGAVLLTNILLTDSNQSLILSSMVTTLLFLDFNIAHLVFSTFAFMRLKQIAKIASFAISFFYIYCQTKGYTKIPEYEESIIITMNAMGNYILLRFFGAYIVISSMNGRKNPYIGLSQSITTQFSNLIAGVKAIRYIKRPLILANLVYCLLVIVYIARNQSILLLENLISLSTLYSIMMTISIISFFLWILKKVDQFMIFQLLGPDKKILYVNLLRLDSKVTNNQQIICETLRYICKNAQTVWDTELLAHNYSISYDVIEDYIGFEIDRMIEICFSAALKISSPSQNFIWRKYMQIEEVSRIVRGIGGKQYMFYVVEHILYFDGIYEDFPINTTILCVKLKRLYEAIKTLGEKVKNKQCKVCINAFSEYFNKNILEK